MKEFDIIDSKPAIYLPDLELIAIADLHLGLEASMNSRGHYIPEFQLDDIKEELELLKEETKSDRILINGDLKNQFSTSYSEKREISELLDFLTERFEDIIIIEGNHDTFLEETIEDKGLRMLESYEEDGVLFTHGDKQIEQDFDTLVIGHEHPALALDDEIGVTEKVSCLLYGETNLGDIIVLPAFSKISNGSEVNRMSKSELLSPVLQETGIKNFNAVAISREGGVYDFGKIHNL